MTSPAWRPSHVRLVARYGVRFALRTGGGIVFLMLTLIAGLIVSSKFIDLVEGVLRNTGVTADEIFRLPELTDAVKSITGTDSAFADYLLQDKPALLSAIFIILMVIHPFVVCFGSFNQTAGDIASRGLRYLLLRTERTNVFLGRFLGTILFAAVVTAALVAIVTLYIGIKFHVYGAGALAAWGLQGTFALAILSLPYVALCAWIGAVTGSAAASLVLSLLVAGAPMLVFSVLDANVPGDQGWLSLLWPWGWRYDLLHPDLSTRLVAVLVMVGFTALFLGLGLWTFRKRDL